MKTNWNQIDKELAKEMQSYGTQRAQKALEMILGDEWIEDAVAQVIPFKGHSSDLAMYCLRQIASSKAAKIAYNIYKETEDEETKSQAVWLIQQVVAKDSFQWIEEFLNDEKVMHWGIGVLDQLLICHVIDYEEEQARVDLMLELALKNSNGELKDKVNGIKAYLNG